MSAKSKLTRAESVQIATEASRVPEGLISIQRRIRLPPDLALKYCDLSAADRGQVWSDGYIVTQAAHDDYIIFYKIISALGGDIIRTSKEPLRIELKSRSYEGDDHFQLLLTIIEDLLVQQSLKNADFNN